MPIEVNHLFWYDAVVSRSESLKGGKQHGSMDDGAQNSNNNHCVGSNSNRNQCHIVGHRLVRKIVVRIVTMIGVRMLCIQNSFLVIHENSM